MTRPATTHRRLERPRPFRRGGTILASALLAASTLVSCSEEPATTEAPVADVLFVGTVLTLASDDAEAEALAIRDERILAVGRAEELERHRGPETRVVELGDGVLVPGFIDAHGHVSQLAYFAHFANLASPPVGPVRDIAELQEVLRAHAGKTETSEGEAWIIGRGYDESLLAEGRHPTRDDLDAISRDRPIFIAHVSLHLGVANSRALELAGIDSSTPNPKSGVIRRRPGGSEPNGVLEEHAAYAVFMAMPQPGPEAALGGLRRALGEYARHGFTTVQDGATSPESWQLLEAADVTGQLEQDVIAYPVWTSADAVLEAASKSRPNRRRLALGGVKFVLDGSPQGKTAYLTRPYLIPPDGQGADYAGYPAFEDAELSSGFEKYARRDLQLMVHANGDAAVDQLITALDVMPAELSQRTKRPILIHGQATRLDQLPDLERLGVVPSFFSAHTFFWGDWHRDSVFGPERAARISPTASALDQGLPITIHMDAPVLPPDGLRMIWATVNRRTRSGRVLGPEERIPVMAALAATTRNAAYQHFLENETGTLEVGKRADLVRLSADPRRMEPDALIELEVLETWSRGRRIHP